MPRSRVPEYRFHGSTPPKEGSRTPLLNDVTLTTADQGGTATIRLYNPIDSWGGYWGVSAEEFAEALDQIGDATQIELHINCRGGEVFEAIAIMNLLRNHPARIVARVDGLAASAASFIACAADELVMGQNSELMIHDAWGICVGSAMDMRDIADRLDQMSNNIASVYAAKAGGTSTQWREVMLAETWYLAEEAVAAGLADSVGPVAGEQEAQNSYDLSGFRYKGRAAAPAPVAIAHGCSCGSNGKPAAVGMQHKDECPKGARGRTGAAAAAAALAAQADVDDLDEQRRRHDRNRLNVAAARHGLAVPTRAEVPATSADDEDPDVDALRSGLTQALGLFTAIDNIVDQAQADIAEILGVPNPDDDDVAPTGDDEPVESAN